MFNDEYGLTKAVLNGEKNMTRRIVPNGTPLGNWNETLKYSRYKPGDIVAIAQSYSELLWNLSLKNYERILNLNGIKTNDDFIDILNGPGLHNKMFVRANYMLNKIEITDTTIERLQDITWHDAIREGVRMCNNLSSKGEIIQGAYCYAIRCGLLFDDPIKAYACLINRICGKGTWESNPFVYVYTFEYIN